MTATTQAFAASEYVCTALSGCLEYILPPLFELCSQIGPNTLVLDVGCGNRSVAAEIAKRGCKIVGIDMSETGDSLAGQNCPTGRFEVFPADENLLRNLGEEPFDFVYSLEVIEHLYDPQSFVAGCFSATRHGGRFVCSTPYHGYAKNLLISLLDGWDKHLVAAEVGEHIKFFSRKTLSRLLEGVGFRDLEFRGGGRVPYLWKSMLMSGVRP
jgi:2-polyprenyl-3-methyl-5-hydroxy-6-metoxy-1,4-benzoquinol methylase